MRMLELSANSSPRRAAMSNVYNIVNKTEFIVGLFVLEILSILPPEISDEFDDLRRRMGILIESVLI